jgi:hypothetical protein
MEATNLQSGSTTDCSRSGALLAARVCSAHPFSQTHSDELPTDGSKRRANAHSLMQSRPTRYGLPCASCKAYYASDLTACPICSCAERVPAIVAGMESARTLKKTLQSILPYALRSIINLDLPIARREKSLPTGCCDEQGERLLLLSASIREAEADTNLPCILDENHTQHGSASVCLNCYEQLSEKLTRTEAALLMDLQEATQIIYEAVWADPAPAEPSRTYQNAAEALLNELCHRAGTVRPSKSGLIGHSIKPDSLDQEEKSGD